MAKTELWRRRNCGEGSDTIRAPKEDDPRDFMNLTKEERQSIQGEFRRHENDCGSSEVQVALLTHRIRKLTDHLSMHKKDHSTRRGLLMLVGRRSKLLRHLAAEDVGRYKTLIQSLGLRK